MDTVPNENLKAEKPEPTIEQRLQTLELLVADMRKMLITPPDKYTKREHLTPMARRLRRI